MLVTIDDKITRLKEHSVSIEVVERVDRTCFYTAGSSIPLEHGAENILWLHGQHLLDSAEVKAARSAVALGDKKYEDVYEELLRAHAYRYGVADVGKALLVSAALAPEKIEE